MTVERSQISHRTQYTMSDDAGLRCVLVFDTGEDGVGPPVWKVLLPGPGDTKALYSVHDFLAPDTAQLTAWLTSVVGEEAASELAAAVDADPPATAGWQHSPDG
jgi:hypothetical protein